MFPASFLFVSLLIYAITLILQRRPKNSENAFSKASNKDKTHGYQRAHRLVSTFTTLINEDGAGVWPPKANHDSWPRALRPYKEVYLEMVPYLSSATPSFDDEVNHKLRSTFRMSMRTLLANRVSIPQVEKIMRQMQAGNVNILPREQINGFYCVVSVCRHAYRWATIPVVKVAQAERIVEFPPELDVPWSFLQRHFGITAESGNNTANVLLNFDETGARVYKINIHMSALVRSSEEAFFRTFYDIEAMAFPIYKDMISAVVCFEKSDNISCLFHLKAITTQLRILLKIFYNNIVENRVSRSVWLSYVQGFQGWGIGRIVNGQFIKYEGLSGNQVLFFQALDAFLGLDPYLSDESSHFYIPVHQRELCLAFRKHSFWGKVGKEENAEIREEMSKIIKQMKLFRSAHRSRVMPYLEQPAPERFTMTAGKGILEGVTTREALTQLDDLMSTRLRETSALLRQSNFLIQQ